METKNTNPGDFFTHDQISEIFRQYYQINHLKQLYRQGWLQRHIPKDICETVAEHTFGVAILALLLTEKYFPSLDLLKVLKLSLIHDLGEIYAGDITPKDKITTDDKKKAELASLTKVFNENDETISLWDEYEQKSSPEAILVHQIDRLEMAFQASIYEHQGFKPLQEFFDTTRSVLKDDVLKDLLTEIYVNRPNSTE